MQSKRDENARDAEKNRDKNEISHRLFTGALIIEETLTAIKKVQMDLCMNLCIKELMGKGKPKKKNVYFFNKGKTQPVFSAMTAGNRHLKRTISSRVGLFFQEMKN